ncbi:MAG: extensin family protein [Bdellovibrionales bacterium]|nr:extensin family protein [Bdellovibrionales bacterium]
MPRLNAALTFKLQSLKQALCIAYPLRYLIYAFVSLMTVFPAHAQSSSGGSMYIPQNSQVGGTGWIFDGDTSDVVEDDSQEVKFSTEAVSAAPSVAPQYTPAPSRRPNPSTVPTPTPRPSVRQSPGRYVGQQAVSVYRRLAGGDSAVQVSGCGGNVTFGASSSRCGPLIFSSRFNSFLMENMPRCVNEALRSEGLPAASHIHVQNMGSYSYRAARGSSQLSMHATGRSLDISAFNLTLSNGQRVNVPMTIASGNRRFYNAFVQCWRTTIRGTQPGCRNSRVAGAIDCRQRLHHDHVHISLPFCPRKPGIISD